jgi:hypothetical protein
MAEERPKKRYRRLVPKSKRPLRALTKDPTNVFRTLAQRLGGADELAEFLECSRATAYNLMTGRRRWTTRYMERAMAVMNAYRVVPVTSAAKAKFERMRYDTRSRRKSILRMDCDGALVVHGDLMWPLVGDKQHVLYRKIVPKKLKPGDIILARLETGEVLLRAWYPVPDKPKEVYLVTLFRGPEIFRGRLFRTYQIADLQDLRRVVGIWMG